MRPETHKGVETYCLTAIRFFGAPYSGILFFSLINYLSVNQVLMLQNLDIQYVPFIRTDSVNLLGKQGNSARSLNVTEAAILNQAYNSQYVQQQKKHL